jgi:hypothetical protein
MPLTAPQSLTPDKVYVVVARLLHHHDIIPAGAVLDAQTLPAVTIPHRKGFVSDPPPGILPPAKPCANARAVFFLRDGRPPLDR